MKYTEKKFSVGSTGRDAQKKYRQNWEKTFGSEKRKETDEIKEGAANSGGDAHRDGAR